MEWLVHSPIEIQVKEECLNEENMQSVHKNKYINK